MAELGGIAIESMLAAGLVPVMKHLPGHGRALSDSHLELPRIGASLEELRENDFLPFIACASRCPLAMTAHVVLEAVDPSRPATQSAEVVKNIIRGEIGFDGILLSDDLSMNALCGPIEERALRALDAGCDLALHCNGDLEEMRRIASTASALPTDRMELLQAARPMPSPDSRPRETLEVRLAELLTETIGLG